MLTYYPTLRSQYSPKSEWLFLLFSAQSRTYNIVITVVSSKTITIERSHAVESAKEEHPSRHSSLAKGS